MSNSSSDDQKSSKNLENHFEIMEILFEKIPYVFWKNKEGTYLGCNLNQAKAFQLNSVSDFIGKTIYDLISDPESAQIVEMNDHEIMSSGKTSTLEETLITPEGKKTYLSQKQPIHDNNGAVIGLLGFAMDVTQIKEKESLEKKQNAKLTQEKYQLELEKEKHQLEINHYKKISEQQEKFAKIANQVVHDIRSPLASLLMIVKSCDEIPEESRIALREAAMSISDIANHLLSYYKQENNLDKSSTLEPTLLSVLLLQTLTDKKYQYRNLQIDWIHDFSEDSHFAFIRAVPGSFKRMLSNLINNAVDALKEKTGKIIVHLKADVNNVSLSVIDHGKGMSKELIEKIKKRIPTTQEKDNGHGIGMTQIWESIELHHGQLEINSELNQGSTFKLIFPRITPPAWIADKISLYPGDRVVILDDDSSIHTAWKTRLSSMINAETGIELVHFQTGTKAIDFIQSLSENEKKHIYLLTDYELLKQELNGLHVVAQTQIARAILVTSHFFDPIVRERAMKTHTRILPKQLASEIPIELISLTDIESSQEKVDAIILDDNQAYLNSLMMTVFKNYLTVSYDSPENFLQEIKKYHKEAKIFIDQNYDHSEWKGIDIAKILHDEGYQSIYLLSGESFQPEEVPDYLTVVNKMNIEQIENILITHQNKK